MAEINTKKQQLTYHKGITNSPSDYVCSDNELADEVGMIFNGAEHQPIQSPVKKGYNLSGYKIMMIHTLKDESENIILYDEKRLYYSDDGDGVHQLSGNLMNVIDIQAIGNTLIVNTNDGLHYFLWDGSYKLLGNRLPEPEVDFRLVNQKYNMTPLFIGNTADISGMIDKDVAGRLYVKNDKQDVFNDAMIGVYSRNKKEIKAHGGFCNPFAIRYALKLYDGSVANISNPIMMFPSVNSNTWADNEGESTRRVQTFFSFLVYKNLNSIGVEWSDIIKGIELYISDDIDVIDTNLDFKYDDGLSPYINAVTSSTSDQGLLLSAANTIIQGIDVDAHYFQLYPRDLGESYGTRCLIGNQKSDTEIINALAEIGNYYSFIDIGLDKHNEYQIAKPKSSLHLQNITTQVTLPNEDYFGHCPISGKHIYTYNNRLHLTNVRRGFFDGFTRFANFDNGFVENYITATVYIRTPQGLTKVEKKIKQISASLFWFYYPDPRASLLQIGNMIFSLKSHPFLNGAYWINDMLPARNDKYVVNHTTEQFPSATNINHEILSNELWVSDVNNPFVFNASGVVTVGSGSIQKIATQTTALSQGQFGQYPLIAFTTKGLWAINIDNTGVYTSAQPMSREVCNNPLSITQTDGAVFFSSEKGLMVVVGSEVKCVSEQLNGKYDKNITPLQDILKRSGLIAYDYRDSLLWILDDDTDTIYIYNIKAGTFARFLWQGELINNVVNHYPDTLLQDEVGNVYSLLEKPNINSDGNTYTATIVTRPMKLENAFAFKSLRQLKNVFDSDGGTCTLAIQASNDMKNWTDVESLKGKGWKYFKFKYEFANMKATDRFAGTFLVTQERYTEKLR